MTARRGLLRGLRAGRRSMRILPQILALVLAIGAFPHPCPPVPAFYAVPHRARGARSVVRGARRVLMCAPALAACQLGATSAVHLQNPAQGAVCVVLYDGQPLDRACHSRRLSAPAMRGLLPTSGTRDLLCLPAGGVPHTFTVT
jgi:hypothetical protein